MIARTRLAPFVVLAIIAAAMSTPAEVQADLHLRLTASSPAKDTVLATPPTQLVLTYSQQPQVRISAITLTGPEGAVALSPVTADSADNKKLTAMVTGAMGPGAYVIAWRTASSDGHPIRGEIPFRIR